MPRWIIEYEDTKGKVQEHEIDRWAKMAPCGFGPNICDLRFVSVQQEKSPVDQDENEKMPQ